MPQIREKITEQRMREIFNRSIQRHIDTGVYTLTVIKEVTPNPKYNLPSGTLSTTFEILDRDGNRVARAHAFVKRDGTYAASGMLDPKVVVTPRKLYYL